MTMSSPRDPTVRQLPEAADAAGIQVAWQAKGWRKPAWMRPLKNSGPGQPPLFPVRREAEVLLGIPPRRRSSFLQTEISFEEMVRRDGGKPS